MPEELAHAVIEQLRSTLKAFNSKPTGDITAATSRPARSFTDWAQAHRNQLLTRQPVKMLPATAVRLVHGRLDLSAPDALEENPTAEVQNWTGFTSHSTHAADADPRMVALQQHLHAALLAWSPNLRGTNAVGLRAD